MSQNNRILNWLQYHGPLTQKIASEKLAVGRLGARIYDMQKEGHVFEHKTIEVSNQYGTAHVTQYTLLQHKDQMEMTL